jgi:hypothetical protein
MDELTRAQGATKPFLDDVVLALKPYGYQWLVSATGITGPGNLIIVFAGLGDFYTACLTHDSRVLWCHSCGGYGDTTNI